MPPRRQSLKKQSSHSLKDFLNTYDIVTLGGALSSLESGDGWNLLKAYAETVQRKYEVDALDMMAKHDMQHAASYASGYAKGVSDLVETFIQGLRETIVGKSSLVENPRPEEQ